MVGRIIEYDLAIIIPQRARIDQPLALYEHVRLRPFAARVGRGRDVDAFVDLRKEDPELSRVLADRRAHTPHPYCGMS